MFLTNGATKYNSFLYVGTLWEVRKTSKGSIETSRPPDNFRAFRDNICSDKDSSVSQAGERRKVCDVSSCEGREVEC